MADGFDWGATLDAILATGAVEGVVAADTEGNIYDARPVSEAGEYSHYVYGGELAYDTEVTQEDGSTKTEKIDEVGDLLKLATGSFPPGKGIRLNGTKFMVLRPLDKATYTAKIDDGSGEESHHNVTIDKVNNLKKGSSGAVVAEKGGYVFIGFQDNSKPEQQPPAGAEALAVGFYWAVGPDPEE